MTHIAEKLAELGVQSLQDYVDPPFVREKLVKGENRLEGEGGECQSEEHADDVPPSWLFDGD